MSIADKLTYLNTTKQLLKTEINKINNVLTDQSTFRSYPEELFNGYLDILNNGTDTLWNNLEKVSQTGTEAVLEGVETAPMKMVLNGNTSQDTTTGKNLLGLTNGTYSHNGITAVVNDGTITITGTATANSFVNIPLLKNIVLSDEQVTITTNNATTISDSATEFRVYESGNNYMPVDFTSINSKRTYTKTGTFVSAYVRTTSGVNYGSGLVIKPQLEQGSTATSWEKYTGGIPSPNPDYPQQVKVVKGENFVSVQGKNKFNIDNILIGTKINDRTFTATHVNGKLIEMDFDPNLKYNIGFKITQDHESNGVFVRIMYTDGTNVVMSSTSTDTVSKTILTTKAIREILLQYSAYSTITTFEDFYIYEETSDTDYVPYSKTDYPINLGDIELCKINTYKDFPFKAINGNEYYDTLTDEQKNALVYGKWYVHKETGKVVLDGDNKRVVYNNVYNNIYQFYYLVSSVLTNYNQNAIYVFTNFFKGVVWSNNWTIDNSSALQNNGNLRLNTSKFDNANDFNLWLTTHNLIVYYVLATPTEEEITNTTLIEQLEAIYKAKSVKDKTYITQTNDELPFILDVQAIKEYEVV